MSKLAPKVKYCPKCTEAQAFKDAVFRNNFKFSKPEMKEENNDDDFFEQMKIMTVTKDGVKPGFMSKVQSLF